jgi:hypothetical protein
MALFGKKFFRKITPTGNLKRVKMNAFSRWNATTKLEDRLSLQSTNSYPK